jgi:RNA polymerase sigma factor (sigma-70 family)
MPLNCLFPDKNAVHEPATENLAAAWEDVRPELSRLVRAMGVGSANADDILQEVYLTAREKCPQALRTYSECPISLREMASESPLSLRERARVREDLRKWLIRVTVNRCRLEHRRTGRWRRAFMALTHLFDRRAPNAAAAETLSRDAQRQQVHQALQSLDADTRSLLVLRYFADFDSTEIGLIMQLPDATVRGRLCRARQKLADRLRQTGYRHEE